MKTLKELLYLYGGQLSDLEIIQKYFIDNGLEAEGIELMRNIATEKMRKQDMELSVIKGNLKMYMPAHYNKEWSEKLQTVIENATLLVMSNQELPQCYIDVLREEVPKYNVPHFIWQKLYEKLKELDIIFKDDKNEKS